MRTRTTITKNTIEEAQDNQLFLPEISFICHEIPHGFSITIIEITKSVGFINGLGCRLPDLYPGIHQIGSAYSGHEIHHAHMR